VSPSDITTILAKLARVEAKIDAQDETMKRIESEVRKTNGRVTTLEAHDRDEAAEARGRDSVRVAQREARERWNGWFQPVISGIVVVVFSALIVALSNLDKL
jgi:hypothetical protein